MEKTQQHESVVEQSGIHCRITNVMGGGVNIWFDRGLRVPSSRRSRNDRLHFNHFNLFRCRNFFFIILFIGKLRLNNDQILIPILPRRLDECVQTAAVIRPTTRWNRIMSTIPNIPKFIRKRSKFNTRACRRSGGHELVSLHALKESNGLWLHEFERREPKKIKKSKKNIREFSKLIWGYWKNHSDWEDRKHAGCGPLWRMEEERKTYQIRQHCEGRFLECELLSELQGNSKDKSRLKITATLETKYCSLHINRCSFV